MSDEQFDRRPARVLVVDDEPDLRLMLAVSLAAEGWAVDEAETGEEALLRCRRRPPDVLVLDQRMPGLTGLEVVRRLRAEGLRLPVILFSAYLDPALSDECRALGLTAVDKLDWPSVLETCRRLANAAHGFSGIRP